MRPWFGAGLVAAGPILLDTVATAGSCMTSPATALCRSARAGIEMSCAPLRMPASRPVSCCGNRPFGIVTNKAPVNATMQAIVSSVANWWRNTTSSIRPYAASSAPNPRSSQAAGPRGAAFASGRRSSSAHRVGVSVSETAVDMAMATATVTANSCSNCPTTPPISSNGMNTAISETEIDRMVKPTSPAPTNAASRGDRPASICRTTFSTMTIASSTTKPTAIDSAIRDRLSSENPSMNMAVKVPTIDSGTAMAGIAVAHTRRRNTRIVATTSAIVSSSVNCTSATLARMVSVRSETTLMAIAGGREAIRRGSSRLMPSTVSSTFAPGRRWMLRPIEGCVPNQAASWLLAGPISASPTSRTRTGPPLRKAMMASLKPCTVRTWSVVSTA